MFHTTTVVVLKDFTFGINSTVINCFVIRGRFVKANDADRNIHMKTWEQPYRTLLAGTKGFCSFGNKKGQLKAQFW